MQIYDGDGKKKKKTNSCPFFSLEPTPTKIMKGMPGISKNRSGKKVQLVSPPRSDFKKEHCFNEDGVHSLMPPNDNTRHEKVL